MLRPALAQLAAVESLVDSARGRVRPALLNVAQQWAQFVGWLCRDTGDLTGARTRCAQAFEWAAELGDQTMTATILVDRCYMVGEAGKVGAMIGLAQAAQRDPSAASGQRALAAGLEARGHAMAGDLATAERKLDQSRALAATVADRPQDVRPWSYWMTPLFFQYEAGITCAYLAGAAPRWHSRAIELLEAKPATGGLALWTAAANLTHLTFAHAQAGDLAEACATALRALEVVRLAGSVRHAAMLAHVHANLHARYPDDARVNELAEALR